MVLGGKEKPRSHVEMPIRIRLGAVDASGNAQECEDDMLPGIKTWGGPWLCIHWMDYRG